MPNKLNNKYFPTLTRISQENVFNCGPAVIQMLLSFVGYDVTQNEIVHAANIESKIKIHGATIQDLALAVAKLYPHELQFWYKFNSTLSDLSTIVNTYHYPVGVEWQGLFDWPDDEDDDQDEYYDEDDDDAGHYSIITHIDTMQNEILIAAPEKHYATGDRKFTILGFEHRWWDINKIPDPSTGHLQEVDDNHALFIITPKYEHFPHQLHLIPAQQP